MTRIRIKRVYESKSPGDGCRVLIDRLWPRGMRRETLAYDSWGKDLAPSDDLRRWFHEDPDSRWAEFGRRYETELQHSQAVRKFLRDIAGAQTVTLLYASKNETENHALILQRYLERCLSDAPQGVTGA